MIFMWFLQTTGLDVDQDTIMEVAVVVTNSLLNVLAESLNFVLKVEDRLITNMKQPYLDQHTKVDIKILFSTYFLLYVNSCCFH